MDARGCDPARLTSQRAMTALFDAIVDDLELHVVGTSWHVFPGHGGVTGVYMLSESHLTVHTFPEHGSLCLNLFCCRPRADWDFAAGLAEHAGATDVEVRRVTRDYSDATTPQTT